MCVSVGACVCVYPEDGVDAYLQVGEFQRDLTEATEGQGAAESLARILP